MTSFERPQHGESALSAQTLRHKHRGQVVRLAYRIAGQAEPSADAEAHWCERLTNGEDVQALVAEVAGVGVRADAQRRPADQEPRAASRMGSMLAPEDVAALLNSREQAVYLQLWRSVAARSGGA